MTDVSWEPLKIGVSFDYFVINASLFRFQLNDLRAFKTDLSDSLVERKRDNGEPISCLSHFTLALASVWMDPFDLLLMHMSVFFKYILLS